MSILTREYNKQIESLDKEISTLEMTLVPYAVFQTTDQIKRKPIINEQTYFTEKGEKVLEGQKCFFRRKSI